MSVEWIKCSEQQPPLKDGDWARKMCNVAVPSGDTYQVTTMTYERIQFKSKTIERWSWHDRIAKNQGMEPEYWQPLPEPPTKEAGA